MPYITPQDRVQIDEQMSHITPQDGGELQYMIATLIQNYYENACSERPRYADMEMMMGALNGASLEHYRCVVAPYEDYKMEQNGGVYNVRRGESY
jgi:hypothetical protein